MILLISVAIVSLMLGCGVALITIGACATGKRADPCGYCHGCGIIKIAVDDYIGCPMCHGFTRKAK